MNYNLMESILEYKRTAIRMNGSLYITLPKPWTTRYGIEPMMILSVEVLSDGSLVIRPGEVIHD